MSERKYWVGFSLAKGVGPVRVRQLLAAFGSLREAWGASESQLREVGLDHRTINSVVETRQRIDLDGEVARLDRLGVAILTWDDEDYPVLLKELRLIDHAPPVLYARGTLVDSDQWCVTIVGTRNVSAYGQQVAYQLAGELAANGITVASGLARGVDSEAHQAALSAGGRTVAVMACGMDQIYPPENRKLAGRIIRNGALLSPFPLGTKPQGKHFPARNRVLSGLSRAVLVIEAGMKSGALVTARHALEQGRDVFAVPGNITAHNSAGTNQLIQDGAYPVTSAEDVLAVLNMQSVPLYEEARRELPSVDGTEAAIYALLSADPTHIDDLTHQSGLAANEVNSALMMLQLKGMIREVGQMMYTRA